MASDLEQKARELLDAHCPIDYDRALTGANVAVFKRAALDAIVAALRAAPEQRAAEGFAAADMSDAAASGFERGQAVPEDVRRDAARYRWLRVRWGRTGEIYDGDTGIMIEIGDDPCGWTTDAESLDLCIDAAMAEGER